MKEDKPNQQKLFQFGLEQEGHFTTEQAAEAGFSTQLLLKYMRSNKVKRIQRGIYRLVLYPPGAHEELVVVWLWSEREGIFSHQTALSLYELSDAFPASIHLTLPLSWKKRRVKVPPNVLLYFADVPATEKAWKGSVPVTSVARTLRDCVRARLAPELLRQAKEEAMQRGLVTKGELADVEHYLYFFEERAV
jgi:predicted transcriptional regulator of viral defense system